MLELENVNVTLNSCRLNRVDELRLPLINRFYADCNYKVKCGRNDKVYSITRNGEIIAAARLIWQTSNCYLLRNLCVAPELRNQGIASYLMKQMLADLAPYSCYCYALHYLQQFYSALNFQVLTVAQVPQDIGEVYLRHQVRKRGWILMGFTHST